MSNNAKVSIGVDDTNTAVAKWYDTNSSNPQVTMANEQGSSDGTSQFKIKKRIGSTNTEIMRIDDDGQIVFKKNVKFDGGSTIIDSTTISLEDQKLEIGLSDSQNIGSVSVAGSSTTVSSVEGYIYTFTISTPVDSGNVYTAGDYVYFQNTYVNNGGSPVTYTEQTKFQDAIQVLGTSTTPAGSDPTSSTFQVWVTGSSVTLDNTNKPIVVGKLSSLTDNTGLKILANNSGSLVEAKMAFDTDDSNSLKIDNTVGNIKIGTETNNTIVIGSNSSTVSIPGAVSISGGTTISSISDGTATFAFDSSGGTTLSGATTVEFDSSSTMELNSSGGAISIGNDDDDQNINIGTQGERTINIANGAFADTLNIGNTTGATTVNINSGTGGIALASTGTGDITLNSDDTMLLDADGVLELNSSGGAISIGNDNVDQNINLATGGTRTLNIGINDGTDITTLEIKGAQNHTATTFDLNASGNVTLDSSAGSISIGSDTNTGNINIGNGASARTIQVGNNSSTAVNLNAQAINLTTSSDFKIDSGTDIILDADGGDIFLKDNNVTFGSLTNTSGNLILKSGTTTAVTFSGADATIAGDLTVSGNDIKSNGGTTAITLSSTNATIAGDLTINGNDIKSNGGSTAITLSNENVTVAGDLTINGNDIYSSTALVMTLSGEDVSVAGELTSSSDRRLKTNIVNLNNSLEIIKNLNGVNFNWIKDNNNGRLQTGFIAQDVELVSPELVKEKEDGYKAVNYIGIIPHLVEGMKQQQKIIEELKAKIENK